VLTGNIAGLAIIIIAALWAPQIQKFHSVVKYFQELLSFVAPPVVAVFLVGLFWHRANGTAAFVSLISGLVLAGVVALERKVFHVTVFANMHFLYMAPIIFALSVAIIVVTSLLTAPPPADKVQRFVWQRRVFAEESHELAALPWYQNYRVLSVLLLLATVVFVYIWR
jgi:SSS family solute:Na+ symporter